MKERGISRRTIVQGNIEALRESRNMLEKASRLLIKQMDDETDDDGELVDPMATARLAKELAIAQSTACRASASNVETLIKLDKADKDKVDKMNDEEADELVVSYIRDMTPERRARVRVEIELLDKEERTLSL